MNAQTPPQRSVSSFKLSVSLRSYLGLIGFSILGTLATRLFQVNPGPMPVVGSVLTMLFGVGTLVQHFRLRAWVFATVTLGAAAEVIGIYTGLPFGRYRYTDAWKPVLNLPGEQYFPVLVPLAWFLVVGACFLLTEGKYRILWSAGLATLIDFAMESVMVDRLHYWQWLGDRTLLPGGAAYLNSVGWFLVSLGAALMLQRAEVTQDMPAKTESRWVLGGFCALLFTLFLVGSTI